MANWAQLSSENLAAAKLLLDYGYYRSCVSRAYYAAYAAVTFRLIGDTRVSFAFGRNNPSHGQRIPLLVNNIADPAMGVATRRRLKRVMAGLQRGREIADYIPGQTMDRMWAIQLVRDAGFVTRTLEVTQ